MRRFGGYVFTWIAMLTALPIFAGAAAAQELPDRASYVNDFADLFGDQTKTYLESLLKDFEEKTTHQLVAAAFPSLVDVPIESFAARLADHWKLGYKDLANGVLLIVAEKERAAWIHVEPGLDARLPYEFRLTLLRSEAAPHFRNSEFDEGIVAAVHAVIRHVEPSYSFTIASENDHPLARLLLTLSAALIFLIFILDVISYLSYRAEVLNSPERAHWKGAGTYSFIQWWFLSGSIATAIGRMRRKQESMKN